jgi:hypothetical protein
VVVIILIGSLVCGFIVSIYYNSIMGYVNECGEKDKLVAFYFGINTCIIQSANIVGSAMSAAMI